MKRALSMTTLFSIVLLAGLLPVGAANQKKNAKRQVEETIYGTVTCTVAAPRPPAGATQTPPDSTLQCLGRHGTVVIVEEPRRDAIPVENPDALKGYEGHRVSASGYKNGDAFHVVSVRGI